MLTITVETRPGQAEAGRATTPAAAPTLTTAQALPYGPILQRLLRPLQHAFLPFNRWLMGPMLRSPLWPFVGNPFTAHLLLLRTRGRHSGVLREAPLGYVIRDGFVYCVAGYGVRTPWFLNLLADPAVEVRLPGRTLRGRAEVVTDDAEWAATFRALMGSFGLVGRLVDGNVDELRDAELIATHRALPVIRIVAIEPPGPIVAGPWDPGGRGWLAAYAGLGAIIASVAALMRRGAAAS
jgi:deazaflavin-dependent oxidoreductase (nitroreductase family)